jgi:L-amino acid N-acyltransferase YncA
MPPMRPSPTGTPGIQIMPMTAEHSAAVLAIYQAGMDEGNATFETRAPSSDNFRATPAVRP